MLLIKRFNDREISIYKRPCQGIYYYVWFWVVFWFIFTPFWKYFLLHIKLEILYHQGFNVNFRIHNNKEKSRKIFPSNKGNNSSLNISFLLYICRELEQIQIHSQYKIGIVSPFSNYYCWTFRRTIFPSNREFILHIIKIRLFLFLDIKKD